MGNKYSYRLVNIEFITLSEYTSKYDVNNYSEIIIKYIISRHVKDRSINRYIKKLNLSQRRYIYMKDKFLIINHSLPETYCVEIFKS